MYYILYAINHLIVILLAIRITLGSFPKSFSFPLSASTKKNRRVKSQLFILLPLKKHDSHIIFKKLIWHTKRMKYTRNDTYNCIINITIQEVQLFIFNLNKYIVKLDYFICAYYWLGQCMQPKLALNTIRTCPQNPKFLKQKPVMVCCGIFKQCSNSN